MVGRHSLLRVNQRKHRALWPIVSPHLPLPPQPHWPRFTIPTPNHSSISSASPFSTSLYVANAVESTDVARQTGASSGKIPRLAAKVAAPSKRLSPNGCTGRKSRIARLGKQREEVR